MSKLLWFGAPALALAFVCVTAFAQADRAADRAAERGKGEERRAEQADKAEAAEEAAKAEIGKAAPDFTLKNAKGEEVKLSSFNGKIVVLEWINLDCPWVRPHYADKDTLVARQSKLREAGVVWLHICSSGDGKQGHFKDDTLTERLKQAHIDAAHYLIDADGKVGRSYEARTTPHVYIIDAEGMLRYRGAMDNYPAQRRGNADPVCYVTEAIETLNRGDELATTERTPYG